MLQGHNMMMKGVYEALRGWDIREGNNWRANDRTVPLCGIMWSAESGEMMICGVF